MEKHILFDDWNVRAEGVLKRRKIQYIFASVPIGILFVLSVIGMFFHLACIVPLVLSVIGYMSILLEWLKIKNNHLIIIKTQIEITNRFHKTKIYPLEIQELTIELRHSFNYRSGGIVMLFYDKNHQVICKYEDMFNHASPYGVQKTNWENALANLGVKIMDPTEIIKN